LSKTDPEFNDLFEKTLFTKDPTFAGHPEYTRWVLANNRTAIPLAPSVTPSTEPTPSPVDQPTVPVRRIRI
jgi:hypothetical protein